MSASDTDEILTDVFNSRKADAYLYAVDCPLTSDWSKSDEEMT